MRIFDAFDRKLTHAHFTLEGLLPGDPRKNK